MEFCGDNCLTGITETEKTKIFRRIRRKVGAPVMGVELVDEQIEECICEAIEEYSTHVNSWVLRNRMGEMLGLPSDVQFTLKYISNSFYFEKSFAKAVGEQKGLGANGTRPMILEEGSAKIHCEKPYQIERLEKNGEIIWYGYNTNWKYSNYAWSKLEGGEFIPCEEPEYETIYKELIR